MTDKQRGFASMSAEKRKELGRKGGMKSPQNTKHSEQQRIYWREAQRKARARKQSSNEKA